MHVLSSGRFGRRALALAMLLLAPAGARAGGWGGSVGLVSDYVYRGLTQSDNQPAGQLDLHYYGGAGGDSGWFAGLWASSVRRSPYYPTTVEFDPYLGYRWSFAEAWSARLAAVHHDYPWNNPGRRYDYDEVAGTVAWADRALLTVSVSPDTSVEARDRQSGSRVALSYDLALRQPLPHAFSLDAGVGYYDLHRAVDTGYVYWNGGLGWDWRRLHLELSYIGTGGNARELFYDGVAVRRLVAGALWHF
jgi:uncharacterized protein (TIGR02001 family)